MGSETEINSAEGGEGTPSVSAAKRTVSVVIAAHNAERTLGAVLRALESQSPPPSSVIVVDDCSTDRTVEVAESFGARVVSDGVRRFAGGSRNRGWDEADGDVVVFLDSDAVPEPGWSAGLHQALDEFPGAIVGCARTFSSRTAWGWVAHLQIETPHLPRGGPREVPLLSSYCMAVPRDAPLRWDESYGGEDGLFSVDAREAGFELVFDPRFHAVHIHERETFSDLRKQQRRMAYGFARCRNIRTDGVHKRIASRVPLHYFALIRLPIIYRRLNTDTELRSRFLRLLPRMVVAEWTYGLSACHYALKPPPLHGDVPAF
jgi:glycosyltransferase involved in cell wall biosynthesis